MITPTSDRDALLTPAEVAAILYVDPRTVSRWATAGKLHPVRTPGGHRRFPKSEVLDLMTCVQVSQPHHVAAAAMVAEAAATARSDRALAAALAAGALAIIAARAEESMRLLSDVNAIEAAHAAARAAVLVAAADPPGHELEVDLTAARLAAVVQAAVRAVAALDEAIERETAQAVGKTTDSIPAPF